MQSLEASVQLEDGLIVHASAWLDRPDRRIYSNPSGFSGPPDIGFYLDGAWAGGQYDAGGVSMSIGEQDLPGIGRRYEIVVGKGQRVLLVVHHSGRRVLYVIDRHADQPTCTVELTDDQARRIGAILGGAFFKPGVVEEIEDIVGEFVVDWVTLPDDAAAVGRSITDLQIRRRTGFSVVAIVRGKITITAPDPGEVLRSGDRLVVVGRYSDLRKFVDLVTS